MPSYNIVGQKEIDHHIPNLGNEVFETYHRISRAYDRYENPRNIQYDDQCQRMSPKGSAKYIFMIN